jgi:hypothetical protein
MTLKNQQRTGLMATKQPWYHGVTLPWEQNIIDNAINYSIVEWRSLGKTTKTIVKTYKEAKELYDLTKKEHSATLVYAINEQGSHANMNHLSDFNTKDTHVKSKKR